MGALALPTGKNKETPNVSMKAYPALIWSSHYVYLDQALFCSIYMNDKSPGKEFLVMTFLGVQ